MSEQDYVTCLNLDCRIMGGRLGPGAEAIRQQVEVCTALSVLAREGPCPMRIWDQPETSKTLNPRPSPWRGGENGSAR